MLKNAPTLAIVAVHTAENEPPKVLKTPEKNFYLKQCSALIQAETGLFPTGFKPVENTKCTRE